MVGWGRGLCVSNAASLKRGAFPFLGGPVGSVDVDRAVRSAWGRKGAQNAPRRPLPPPSALQARIIIATDMDEPGNALAEELARRLGRERCWRARWPDQLKDANDVLVNKGVDAVAAAIKGADAFPIRGLFRCGVARVVRRLCRAPVRRSAQQTGVDNWTGQ